MVALRVISLYELADMLTRELGYEVNYNDIWVVAKRKKLPLTEVTVTRSRVVKGLRENYAEIVLDYFRHHKRWRKERRSDSWD